MKKVNKKELDVDFIGEQKPLTEKEEKQLSEYFKRNKQRKTKLKTKKETYAD